MPISAAHPASTRPAAPAAPRPTTIGMLSTYPPTQCGLATFSAALIEHLQLSPGSLGVVRVVDQPEAVHGPDVVGHLVNGSATSAAGAVRRLNGFDAVVVQHEYGITADRMAPRRWSRGRADAPTIVVLHTVLQQPDERASDHPRCACRRGRRRRGHDRDRGVRLVAGYGRTRQGTVIPHGAVDHRAGFDPGHRPPHHPPMLTWGLIGPGKGIEWAIER